MVAYLSLETAQINSCSIHCMNMTAEQFCAAKLNLDCSTIYRLVTSINIQERRPNIRAICRRTRESCLKTVHLSSRSNTVLEHKDLVYLHSTFKQFQGYGKHIHQQIGKGVHYSTETKNSLHMRHAYESEQCFLRRL
jgi:hypothetical protein